MKHLQIIFIFCSVVLCAVLAGCRVNNGDIGPLYGVWNVTAVDVDGEPYDGWKSHGYTESFFQFQNNICFVTRTNDLYDSQSRACTWQWLKKDTEIELDFSHTDTASPNPGSYLYAAPEWLLLTESRVYVFSVDWEGSKKMTWSTVNTAGQRLTYHLTKTY